MTPHMSGRDISFSTLDRAAASPTSTDNPVWGVADELPGAESDAIERDIQSCFSCADDAAWLALRSRLREQKSIKALRGLVAYLDGIRESRKAVIAVTKGWRLFTENPTRMTDEGTKGRVVGVQPIGVGPDGRARHAGSVEGGQQRRQSRRVRHRPAPRVVADSRHAASAI